MKFSSIRRILKEDLTKKEETPKWVDGLLGPLNDFLEQTVRALSGRLTFTENLQSVVKSVELTHAVAKDIATGSSLRIAGAWLSDADGGFVEGFGFVRKTNGTLTVTAKFDTAQTKLCKIIILLE